MTVELALHRCRRSSMPARHGNWVWQKPSRHLCLMGFAVVFVYKLIVAGSIEEKILALQERKSELAAGILSEDSNVDLKFGADDLAALFSPLPD